MVNIINNIDKRLCIPLRWWWWVRSFTHSPFFPIILESIVAHILPCLEWPGGVPSSPHPVSVVPIVPGTACTQRSNLHFVSRNHWNIGHKPISGPWLEEIQRVAPRRVGTVGRVSSINDNLPINCLPISQDGSIYCTKATLHLIHWINALSYAL